MVAAMGQNRSSEWSQRRKAGRGDDVYHLFDGCRRDRGDDRKEMEN